MGGRSWEELKLLRQRYSVGSVQIHTRLLCSVEKGILMAPSGLLTQGPLLVHT